MNRLLKTAVLVLLLALVPFRGIAAATVGHCAATQKDSVHAQADFQQSSPDHDDRAEHCTSMLVVLSADRMSLSGDMGAERTAHGEPLAAGFIPEHLDPPPLAG